MKQKHQGQVYRQQSVQPTTQPGPAQTGPELMECIGTVGGGKVFVRNITCIGGGCLVHFENGGAAFVADVRYEKGDFRRM